MTITDFYFRLSSSVIHKTRSSKGYNKQNFTLLDSFVNKTRHIYKACYKTAKYRLETCYYK